MMRPLDVQLVDGPLPAAQPWHVDGAGAVCVFDGVVRSVEEEQVIDGLDYESYDPMAQRQLQLLAEEAINRFELLGIVVRHSRGFVPVGRCSFRLSVASKHRKAAMAAMDWFIDRLKQDVPIWKRPREVQPLREEARR